MCRFAPIAVLLALGCGAVTPNTDAGSVDAGRDAGPVDAGPPCLPVMVPNCPSPAPSYETDVAPVVSARCVACHGPGTAHWPLTQYRHLADWQNEIRDFVGNCLMPPPESPMGITHDERVLLLGWLRCGLPP